MSRSLVAVLIATLAVVSMATPGLAQAVPTTESASDSMDAKANVRKAIERHLGRPYVWGASGLKSFDCSGFVWRVMLENGILVKRTTARKFYLCLPKVSAEDRWDFGNIVFFSNLKHCGIVDTKETFYHAAVSVGTHLTEFSPLWRSRITGIRAMPRHEWRLAERSP